MSCARSTSINQSIKQVTPTSCDHRTNHGAGRHLLLLLFFVFVFVIVVLVLVLVISCCSCTPLAYYYLLLS
jgi:hypothetical protein